MEEPLAPVTRADFERFAAEIRGEIAAAVAASAPAGGHDVLSDILGQLRVLKWAMGLALVAVMGALGVLYQGQANLGAELRAEFRAEISGLRAEFRAEISGLRAELRGELSGLRAEFRGELSGLRTEISALREEMQREFTAVREEMRREFKAVREEMRREFKAVRRDVAGLGERVARLESGQTFILGRLEEISGGVRPLESTGGEEVLPEAPATS